MRRRAPRSRRDGFTLLEVMLSIAIMLVAIMGIVALQRAAINANIDSRATATATENNHRWASILRRSALSWTSSDVSSIPYLSSVSGAWFVPNGGDEFGLDWFGAPTTTSANVRFCTIVRLRMEHPDASMRADIVTFWGREGVIGGSGVRTARQLCSVGNGSTAAESVLGTTGAPNANLRHVRTTITLRRTVP